MAKNRKSGNQDDHATKRIILITAIINLVTALVVLLQKLTG